VNVWQSRRGSAVACAMLFAGLLATAIPLGCRNKVEAKKYEHPFPALQDARTVTKAKSILETWNGNGGNQDIRVSMQLDLAFALFYAPLLALLAYRASVHRTRPGLARLGRWCGAGALIGGLADLVENAIMLTMLGHPERARWQCVLLVFVVTKLVGAATAVLYIFFSHLDTDRASLSYAADASVRASDIDDKIGASRRSLGAKKI
jgi:hypothetical protein